jgi:5-hydroxyisourate hydrolase
MSAVTTHVLDLSRGRPAAGVEIHLEKLEDGGAWSPLGRGATDDDGRLRTLLPGNTPLLAGTYRLVFSTGAYFARLRVPTLYPHVTVVFNASPGETHYHVPLLLSPYGYSTYRGS